MQQLQILNLISLRMKKFIFSIKYRKYFEGEDFHHSFRCDNFKNFQFGKRCYIGPFCHFDALGGLQIDDFVIIAPHVKIWTYNHNFVSPRIPYDDRILDQPVSIGKGAWIGLGSIILPGAKIGAGAIVGAGSIVKGCVPDFSIVRPPYSRHEPLRIEKSEEDYYRDK